MATLKVNGMSCEHCKAAVEKAVKNIPGVKSAVVNLDEKALTYEPEDNLPVPEELVIEVIREIGYEPVKE